MESLSLVEEEVEFSDEPLASGEETYYVGGSGANHYPSFQEALEAVKRLPGNANTVKIVLEKGAEFNSDFTINSGDSLEIDLGGETLTIKDGRFLNSSNLKIHNGTIKIESSDKTPFNNNDSKAEMCLEDVTVEGSFSKNTGYYCFQQTGGKISIIKSEIKILFNSIDYPAIILIDASSSADLLIQESKIETSNQCISVNGGQVNVSVSDSTLTAMGAIPVVNANINSDGCNFKFDGSTLTNDNVALACKLYVDDGRVLNVAGGKFLGQSSIISVNGSGKTVFDNVTAENKVANAIQIASESEVELKNSRVVSPFPVNNRGSLTMEKTKIEGSGTGVSNYGVVTLENGVEINMDNYGILNIGGDALPPQVYIKDGVTIKSKNFPAIYIEAGTVTIGNGTIESENESAVYIDSKATAIINGGNFVSNTSAVLSNEGNTTLNGGVYTTEGTAPDKGVIHAASGTLTINGGFFGGTQNFISGSGNVDYQSGMNLSAETVSRNDSGSSYPYKWIGKPIKLFYDLDGGTGDFPEESLFSRYGEGTTGPATDSISTTISNAIPQKDNYYFNGWTAGTDTYAPGADIQINKNTTLKAQWDSIQLKYANGSNGVTTYGTDLEIQAIAKGGSLSECQWYENDTNNDKEGTPVAGGATDTLTILAKTPVGPHYYYCKAKVSAYGSSGVPITSKPIKVVIEPKKLDINNPQAESRSYDGTKKVKINHGGLSGKVQGDDVNLPDPLTGTIENPNAGTGKAVTVGEIRLSGKDEGNYTVNPPQNLNVNITQATLGENALKLENKTFSYGSQIELTPVLDGVNGEQIDAEYEYTWYTDEQLTTPYGTNGETAPSSSGTYYVKVKCTGINNNPNYLLPVGGLSTSATITILDQYIPQPSPSPEIPENYPEGTVKNPDGSYTTPDNVVIKPDQGILLPDGTAIKKDGAVILPGADTSSAEDDTTVSQGTGTEKPAYNPKDGTVTTKKGNEVILPGGTKVLPKEGSVVQKDGTVTEPDGTVISPDSTVTKPDGTVISPDGTINKPDGTIITPDGMVHNPDGSVQDQKGEYVRPAKMVIEERTVKGNSLSINLEKKAAGAKGYDYIISQNPNCIKEKDYLLVNKNTLLPRTSFRYLQKGTYYVAGHAWIQGEDGKKVFGPWSELMKIEVTSITPSTPKIRKVLVKGSMVRVTYTKSLHATGYDLVLGAAARKVNGELRPVEYGRLVRKITKGNIVTAVFENVPEGTYYLGLHAFNRTSEDLKKVFSPWSGARKVIVK